ncbi:MAG TPA: hypothetical protein VGM81_00745 [Burkholderiaceae bacterium]
MPIFNSVQPCMAGPSIPVPPRQMFSSGSAAAMLAPHPMLSKEAAESRADSLKVFFFTIWISQE